MMLATSRAAVQQVSPLSGASINSAIPAAAYRCHWYASAMSNAMPVCALMQVHLHSAKAASERLPGFDHELRLAAVRRGGGLLGRVSEVEPPKGVEVWSQLWVRRQRGGGTGTILCAITAPQGCESTEVWRRRSTSTATEPYALPGEVSSLYPARPPARPLKIHSISDTHAVLSRYRLLPSCSPMELIEYRF